MITPEEFELQKLQVSTLLEIAKELKRIADFFAFFETAWQEADELTEEAQ